MSWYDEKLMAAIAPFMASASPWWSLAQASGNHADVAQEFSHCPFRGGDFAYSAVALASKLYAPHPGVSVQKFIFTPPAMTSKKAQAQVVVVTSQALSRCRRVPALSTLSCYRGRLPVVDL